MYATSSAYEKKESGSPAGGTSFNALQNRGPGMPVFFFIATYARFGRSIRAVPVQRMTDRAHFQ